MLLHPTSEADNLKTRLAQMKFPNPKSIDDYCMLPAPGIQSLHFCDLFALGRDVKDFGKDGDLIWVARRSAWQCFYAEEWFNSRNGKTLKFRADSLAPPKKEKQNQGDGGG